MEVMFIKSIKKKLSIIALAASILGCKSAMAMSPLSGNSLVSAGYEISMVRKSLAEMVLKKNLEKEIKLILVCPFLHWMI